MVELREGEKENLVADCQNCFALCCVALPFLQSADFACNKEGETPCTNLEENNRCSIHDDLRVKGFKGCTVFECFGAGQKVSQHTYKGKSWREDSEMAKEMFHIFPIMHGLHEMLVYLYEAVYLEVTKEIHKELWQLIKETEQVSYEKASKLLVFDMLSHREKVNLSLKKVSKIVRSQAKKTRRKEKKDYIGKKLKHANFQGVNLRGAWFIAADIRGANFQYTDLIGADFRDADIRGADFTNSIFLTQVQIQSANGDKNTKLPSTLKKPDHWK